MSGSPTVFIIDPDLHWRKAVVRITEQMHIAAKEFAGAEEFLATRPSLTPGCVVTEFRLPGMNGIELQNTLTADQISLPVIFVTGYAETNLTVRAMQNGAVTVMEKPFSEQELWDAIRRAITQDQSIRRIDAKHSEVRRRLAELTNKERDVLELLIEGKANKAIAKSLNISIRTVEARRHHIFKKTRTGSIAQLVRLILQTGNQDE